MAVASTPASRRQEHALDTRESLVAAARALFAERGYAATPIEEIARSARVTKGALYHHFADKRELFKAACRSVQLDWVDRIRAAVADEPDAGRRLQLGLDAFLESCLDPETQRIVMLDGPAVLGPDELHAVDERHGLTMIEETLADAMGSGDLDRAPIEPLSHILLGALNAASIVIARAPDPAAARAEVGEALERLVAGLRPRG
ncbi:MAG TPA: helix-turn-helix domain-containing protein [Solirubrobacterales bacterium]